MSRRLVSAHDPELVVWVGWDASLGTFFAQVLPPGDVDDDGLLLWVGTTTGELTEAAQLQHPLLEWASLDDELVSLLEEDRCRET